MANQALLKSWTSHYKAPLLTIKDVNNAVNNYKGLVPQSQVYTFNDGSQMKLVNLTGTVPMLYRGMTYNIPVIIWLMDTHPRNAPICYVQPTNDMTIQVSAYVDQNGKIYLPYLHDWNPNESDLVGLIQVMITAFQEKPPVFEKQKQLPYPDCTPPMSQDIYRYPQPGFPPYAGSFAPYPPTSSTFPYTPTPFPSPYPVYSPPDSIGMPNASNVGTIKDEEIRQSLISAIEDSLMRCMRVQFEQSEVEINTLRKTEMELKQGKMKLESILEQLNREKNELDKNILILKDKEQELEKAIERLENQDSIDVDEAVITTAPLYKQLLNAFAEEAALEDAIYYMGEALRRGVIDLDAFLKQVRTLSRKQFMLRALMQKCRQKAGLARV